MNDPLVKHMVDRFLGWKLPQDFAPDAGISFRQPDKDRPDLWPIGTNLFTMLQALEMVEYMLKDAPLKRKGNQ